MGKIGVIGLYFFEEDNGNAVNVNSERYIEMITSFYLSYDETVFPSDVCGFNRMGRRPTQLEHQWTLFSPLFPGRLISRFGDIHWPPRSPDLSMCDYFLWGHLKAHVCEHKLRTLEELKEAIREKVAQIDRGMIEKVYANFQERLQKCITDNGCHMSDVVFHTWFCKMLFQQISF